MAKSSKDRLSYLEAREAAGTIKPDGRARLQELRAKQARVQAESGKKFGAVPGANNPTTGPAKLPGTIEDNAKPIPQRPPEGGVATSPSQPGYTPKLPIVLPNGQQVPRPEFMGQGVTSSYRDPNAPAPKPVPNIPAGDQTASSPAMAVPQNPRPAGQMSSQQMYNMGLLGLGRAGRIPG